MLKRRLFWISLGIWAALMLGAWILLVPTWLSGWTLGWLSAAALALAVTLAMVLREGASTRSVAHVLYDAEHQTDKGR